MVLAQLLQKLKQEKALGSIGAISASLAECSISAYIMGLEKHNLQEQQRTCRERYEKGSGSIWC